MNIQFKILLQNFKKSWLWIIILFLLAILSLIFYEVRPADLELNGSDFINLIGYPQSNSLGFISLLITIYQIGFTIYYIFIYYSYELEHSFENIIIRINAKKWLFQKIITIILFMIFIRTVYTGLLYTYFYKTMPFEISFILVPAIYHILMSLILITIINFIKIDNGIKLLIAFIISYIFFINFDILMALYLIIILICINEILFCFKRYFN